MERYKSECKNCGKEPITYENEWGDYPAKCTYCREYLNNRWLFPFEPGQRKQPANRTAKQKRRNNGQAQKQKKQKPRVNYDKYIQSKAWRAKREEALEYHGAKCSVCGTTQNLHVHHKTYESLGHEKMKHLEILCKGCHENHHEEDGKAIDPLTREFLRISKGF